MATIGISSVHLLKTIIHGVFILSALGIAFTDRVMLPSPQVAKAKH